MKEFEGLLRKAQMGDDEAITAIIEMYSGLIIKESSLDGVYDDDLRQQLYDTLIDCIRTYRP